MEKYKQRGAIGYLKDDGVNTRVVLWKKNNKFELSVPIESSNIFDNITHLSISYDQPIPLAIQSLPTSLTYLQYWNHYNGNIMIPNSVTHLILPYGNNPYIIPIIPLSVISLNIDIKTTQISIPTTSNISKLYLRSDDYKRDLQFVTKCSILKTHIMYYLLYIESGLLNSNRTIFGSIFGRVAINKHNYDIKSKPFYDL